METLYTDHDTKLVTQFRRGKTLKFEAKLSAQCTISLNEVVEIVISSDLGLLIRSKTGEELAANHNVLPSGTLEKFKITWYDSDIILQRNDQIVLHVPNYQTRIHNSENLETSIAVSSKGLCEWKFENITQLQKLSISTTELPAPPAYAPDSKPENSTYCLKVNGLFVRLERDVIQANSGLVAISPDQPPPNSAVHNFIFVPVRTAADGTTLYKIKFSAENDELCLETKNDIGHVFHQKNGHFKYDTSPVVGTWEAHPNQLWRVNFIKDDKRMAQILAGPNKQKFGMNLGKDGKITMKSVKGKVGEQVFSFDTSIQDFDVHAATKTMQDRAESYWRTPDGRTFIPSFAALKNGHHIHEWTGPSKGTCSAGIIIEMDEKRECFIKWTNFGQGNHVLDVATSDWFARKGNNPGSYSQGTVVHLWEKHGNTNQKWKIEHVSGETYRVKPVGNQNMALDLCHPHPCGWAGTDNLMHLRIGKLDHGSKSQMFNLGACRVEIKGEDCGYMNPDLL